MLKKRLLGGTLVTVLWAAALLLRVVHTTFYDILILFFAITAAVEINNALKSKFTPPNLFFLIFGIVLGYAGYLVCDLTGSSEFGLSAFIGGVLLSMLIMLFVMLFDKRIIMNSVVSTMFAAVYPVVLFGFLFKLNTVSTNISIGMTAILLLISVSSLSDVMAFAIGVSIGKHKLCPSISPKKSVEGAIGGLFGGVLGSMIIFIFCFFGACGMSLFPVPLWANIINFIALGLFGSFMTQCGDLVASVVKRSCEIKDYGKIIVGHGGVMDRLDGVIFNAVFIYSYFVIFDMLVKFL